MDAQLKADVDAKAGEPVSFPKAERAYKASRSSWTKAVQEHDKLVEELAQAEKALVSLKQRVSEAEGHVDVAKSKLDKAHKKFEDALGKNVHAVDQAPVQTKRSGLDALLDGLCAPGADDVPGLSDVDMGEDDPVGLEGEELDDFRKARETVRAAKLAHAEKCRISAEALRATQVGLQDALAAFQSKDKRRRIVERDARSVAAELAPASPRAAVTFGDSSTQRSGLNSPLPPAQSAPTQPAHLDLAQAPGGEIKVVAGQPQDEVERAAKSILGGTYAAVVTQKQRPTPYV